MKKKSKILREIRDYDARDFGDQLANQTPMRLQDIGVKLPPSPPSQVISIRLPTPLLNEIRAAGSERDIPYQALIKQFLFEGIKKFKKTA